ncbi:MAG: hypothetical protein KDC83_13505 [Flavobacteriales bacterium]|nr:hypothetical protein [Flavobacteriales bacterium]
MVLRLKPKIIIGRSVYATNLGLLLKKVNLVDKIVYDGRGAVTAECDEFKMVPFRWLLGIKSLESKSINQSDFQLAVSSALIKHWKSEFAYNKGTYAVLPCVYGESFEKVELTTDNISHARQTLGFSQEDTVITYSGSLAGWQFKTGLEIQLAEWLKMSSHHKLFFLSKNHQIIEDLKVLFPYQCEQRFVTPEEVPKYLIAADYGLLVREKLITNQVASPVKFAEYLSCGLQVIISSEVGDFSEFVQSRNCGFVWDGPLNFPFLEKLNFADKVKTRELAIRFFSDNSTSMMTQVQKSVNQVD